MNARGFKVRARVFKSRHSRKQLRQKGRRLDTCSFARDGINLGLSRSRSAVPCGVFGRRRQQTREHDTKHTGGHDGR